MENNKPINVDRGRNPSPLYIKIIQGTVLLFLTAGSILAKCYAVPYLIGAWYTLQIFILWIAADFITGVIHWWEDTYGNPEWPIIGKYIVLPNMIHHKNPIKLLEGTYWDRINTSFIGAAIIGGILWFLGLHAWQMIVCLLFCAQGNQIHAMSHRPDHANGKWIAFLRKWGLLQNRKTHRWHHQAPYETNFCIMTEFVNPILNKLSFWNTLEKIILKFFKIDVLRCSDVRDGL